MNVNQRLFHLLEIKGYSATDLSKATGIKPNTISDWKTKGTNPSVDKIQRICEFFNVSCDYLLTGKDHIAFDSILSQNEQLLVELYRNSGKNDQAKILEYAQLLNKKEKK